MSTEAPSGDPHMSIEAPSADPHMNTKAPSGDHHMNTEASSGDPHMSTEAPSGDPHMSTEAPSSGSLKLPQVQSSAPKQEQINPRDPDRDQQDEMEYTEDTTSAKIPQPEGDTDNRGYQKGDTIPFLQTITTGGNGPETGHLSGEAVGKMVSAYLQEENTEVTMMAANHPQGGATGIMMPAHPQGGATGTMMSVHPQGGATGTMMSAHPQGGATWTMMSTHPLGGATGTMMPTHPLGGATGTMMSVHPQGGATGTMMSAHPQGGATGTMMSTHPLGGATGTMMPTYPLGGATGTMMSVHPQGGATGTMMSAHPQGGATGTMMSTHPQGGATGTMSAHPQGGATGTMMSAHPQGGATGTMMSAHPQGGATGTMMSAHPQGGATGTMMPTHPLGGATGTMMPTHPLGGATGTMMSAHPQGGATETMMPTHPLGGATGTMMPTHPLGGATGTMMPTHPLGGATGTMMLAHPQGGATGTMMPVHPQGGATRTMMPTHPLGGATGTMMSAHPQGGATETMMPTHPQGGATGTMMSAHPQGGATGTMMPTHPQGGATGTMMSAHPQGGATGTMMSAHPQGGATGTMMSAHPQGGATGTMMPTHSQGGATLVQVKEQIIGNLNVSFPGGEANVLGDGNTVTINKTEIDDEIKSNMAEVKEMVSRILQEPRMPQQNLQSSGAQTNDDVAAVKDTLNATAANTRHTKEIHPNLVPMIETTKALITEEVKKTFLNTKAFRDAKEKLQNNRVVVIKGNTGDGKTCTAIQLLHWLIEEQHDRQPVQIHNIKDFKLLAPKSKLITFVDDIFGEKDLRKNEVQEWNKRINTIIPSLCGDLQTEANFLVITVRNEVFSSLRNCSLGPVFTDLNITDLSTDIYKITEEKKELLDLYQPKNSTFLSWTKNEKEQIVKCAPNVGFPQCCRLFRDLPELQKERVQFFQKPFYFLNAALSKLGECPALLFLFLNDGMIKVKDLDPNSKQINKTLLEEAFEIDLIDGDDDRTSLKYKKKVEFVKKSLDKLLGFLVVKEDWWFDGGKLRNVYRFYHDSIYVAVALLYGEKTPIGYIQNCPRKSLSYITTSKTSTNMIVISSDHYTDMCERLRREFVSEENDYGTTIGSLEVWKDRVFVESFVRLLNDKNVDKCYVLNKACLYGAEECVLYLLSEGVKPNKCTPFCVVRGGVKVLKTIVNDLNDEMKLAVLNKACKSGSEECALYLLSEGVKPDKYTPFCVVEGGCVKVLKTIVNDLNDEMKLAVLNKACKSGSEECALYLLSEGVKPDKYTPFCVVGGGCVYVLYEILQYDVTPTARDDDNNNVLHKACMYGREEMVTVLCDAYPHLVHDTDRLGETPLYVATWSGNCCVFETVERTVRKSLCRVEDEQHKCETVDGRVVHVSCACAQYMSQLVDVRGWTVLHRSCMYEDRETCKFVCESYPALTSIVDKDGRHCLHYIASHTSDVDLFTECETHVKHYLESTGREYDITAIRDSEGRSVLDEAKGGGTENNPLYDHLVKVFGSK